MRGAAFDLDGGDVGIVLLHGFTGTPFEVRYLGDRLHTAGFTVHAPVLPGHCTSLDDLDRRLWTDWTAAVDRAVERVARRCKRVILVGQSLGGLLALHASIRHPVAAVVSLAAPLWLEGTTGQIARWVADPASSSCGLRRLVTRLPKLGGSDVLDATAKAQNPCYPAIPTRALGELFAFMRVVDAELVRVTAPVLVLHATQDHTAPVACAQRIASATRARRVKVFPRSYHLLAVDVERDLVADEVIAFVRLVLAEEEVRCAT